MRQTEDRDSAVSEGEPAHSGSPLRRLAIVAATLAIVVAGVQCLPDTIQVGNAAELNLGEFQWQANQALQRRDGTSPWLASVPVVRKLAEAFVGTEESQLPAFAGAGGAYQAGIGVRPEGLSDAVAQNLVSRRSRPSRTAPSGPVFTVDEEEVAGLVQEIEHPEQLAAFFDALLDTWRGDSKRTTRIAHYGDSSIATDLLTYTMRRHLQRRFGDSGHGFVLVAPGNMPYAHRDVRHRYSRGWQLRKVMNRNDARGLYGYGGVAFRATAGATAEFATDDRGPVGGKVSTFALFYRSFPGAGDLWFRIDRGTRQRFSTAPAEGDTGETDEVKTFTLPDGPHRFEIRPAGGGATRLYGVVMEREGPGVVYDSLGLVGARARRLLNYDRAHIAEQMRLRDPDLLVLGFGGNEADDPMQRMPLYQGEYEQVIALMRGGEQRPCLVLAPLDQARRDKYGGIETIPVVPEIVASQRRAAAAAGCAFFDTFAAMGGEGAMRRWSRSRPRLAMTDYRHATPAGYEVIANMLYKALLSALAEHAQQ